MTVAAEGDELCSQAGSREKNVWPQPWITAQGNSTPIRSHWGRAHKTLVSFFSLSWIALARTCNTVLNNSDKSRHPFLYLDIRGKVYSFLTLTVMLAVCSSHLAFFMLKYLCTHFVESFQHEWRLNFIQSFFCIYWNDSVIFILHFLNLVVKIIPAAP